MIENPSRYSQKATAVWRFTSPGSLHSVKLTFRKVQHSKKFQLFYPADGGTRFLRNVGSYSPVDKHNIQEDFNLQNRCENLKSPQRHSRFLRNVASRVPNRTVPYPRTPQSHIVTAPWATTVYQSIILLVNNLWKDKHFTTLKMQIKPSTWVCLENRLQD